MSRSSFFVGFGSSRLSVPFRRVVGLALSGGCCSWSLRPSSRSFSGSVVWAVFVLVGLALLWRFVLVSVLSLARCGLSLFLSCASFFGGSPPFFRIIGDRP